MTKSQIKEIAQLLNKTHLFNIVCEILKSKGEKFTVKNFIGAAAFKSGQLMRTDETASDEMREFWMIIHNVNNTIKE